MLGEIVSVILGLGGGSFLTVVISRWEKSLKKKRFNWKFVLGIGKWRRSRCDSCGRSLFWWENIPLFSFVFLKGKCRSCHSPIPFWYPLLEGTVGVVFLGTFLFWQKNFSFQPWLLPFFFLTALGLVFVAFFDGRNQIIPDEVILFLSVCSFPLFLFHPLSSLVAALTGGGALFFLHWLTGGKGMGWGDVKFALFMGIFLGFPQILLAFYLAFLTGGIWSVIMILRKKAKKKQRIAFGPFLVLGTIVSWWWSKEIFLLIHQWLT